MLLGSLFKRVALWRQTRTVEARRYRIEELLEMEISDSTMPLAMATFWRDTGHTVFTSIPLNELICYPLVRNHVNLEEIANLLDKSLRLVAEDDYEQMASYLSRRMTDRHDNSVAAYLTDKDGFPLDTEAVFTRISTLLFSMAATLDGLESFEYHRLMNPLYRELIVVVTRLLELKQR
jgi:hypothetical protein